MKIGWIGLGKLGLPCALTLASVSHEVHGYDITNTWVRIQEGQLKPPQEELLEGLIASGHRVVPHSYVAGVVEAADVIFIAVQTPHAPQFGGEEPMPKNDTRDFDYTFLTQAVREVCEEASYQEKHVTVVVVSTALPGTFNRYLRPLQNRFTTLVYNPFFIAMGTTIKDFSDPEFVLIGTDRPDQATILENVYASLHDRPLEIMSIESAELTKVAYNTFISMKIVFGNSIMEICEKTGADCDEVINGLTLAYDRVISAKYMRGGMGDGGHCHPRDLIAMSWLSQRLELSADLMGYLAAAREWQSDWLANLVIDAAQITGMPIVLLGKAYKPESDLIGGSPALLLEHQLRERWKSSIVHWDPVLDGDVPPFQPSVFVIATKHEIFQQKFVFPHGSLVIDPFGYVFDRPGVTVKRVGRKR